MKLAILIIILDFDWLHILFDIYIYFYPENTIDEFMEYFAQSGLMEVFLQNFDFVEKRKTGFGMYGEQGGESIHNEFNQFKTTYCQMQPASKRLDSRIHPSRKQSKVQWLNSKINFVEKGKQPCS